MYGKKRKANTRKAQKSKPNIKHQVPIDINIYLHALP